jgi:hypothetical protein
MFEFWFHKFQVGEIELNNWVNRTKKKIVIESLCSSAQFPKEPHVTSYSVSTPPKLRCSPYELRTLSCNDIQCNNRTVVRAPPHPCHRHDGSNWIYSQFFLSTTFLISFSLLFFYWGFCENCWKLGVCLGICRADRVSFFHISLCSINVLSHIDVLKLLSYWRKDFHVRAQNCLLVACCMSVLNRIPIGCSFSNSPVDKGNGAHIYVPRFCFCVSSSPYLCMYYEGCSPHLAIFGIYDVSEVDFTPVSMWLSLYWRVLCSDCRFRKPWIIKPVVCWKVTLCRWLLTLQRNRYLHLLGARWRQYIPLKSW